MTKENDFLTREIVKVSAMVEETESSLNKATTENQIMESKLKSLMRDLERQSNKKIELEEKMLEMLQDQVMTDQASKKQAKNIREIRAQRRDLERAMFATEHQLSEILFELETIKGAVAQNKLHIEELTVSANCNCKNEHGFNRVNLFQKEKNAVEKKSADYDNELNSLKKTIISKLKSYDALSKQLAQLIEAAGGAEKDPAELKV